MFYYYYAWKDGTCCLPNVKMFYTNKLNTYISIITVLWWFPLQNNTHKSHFTSVFEVTSPNLHILNNLHVHVQYNDNLIHLNTK